MKYIEINENISYIEATNEPLSADIGIINDNGTIWLYDVGADENKILDLNGKYNIVISHFHQDHTKNISKINANNIYVSNETRKHIKSGIVVDKEITIGNIRIFPIPSSHAKGCLGLEYGNYAFIGDSIYSKFKEGYYIFNAQLLKAEIDVLKKIKADYLLISHLKGMIRNREEVILELEEIYSYREGNNSEIKIKK